MLIWSENKAKVAKLNAENASTGVVFKLNETGDLTSKEFKKKLGLKVPEEASQRIASHQSEKSHVRNGGRHLNAD